MNSYPEEGLPAEAAKSVPLLQAFRDHADPKLVAEYHDTKEQLEHEGKWQYIGTPRNIEGYVLSEFDGHGHELLRRSHELIAKIQSLFVNDLRHGRFTAWAREGSSLAPWREIPKAAWLTLQLDDVVKGTAKGPGVALFDVRVGPRHVDPPEPIKAGVPGRPSSAHLVLEEFRRRVSDGELGDVLKIEATILAEWLARTHPKAPPIKGKTVEGVIRAEFNAWKTSRLSGTVKSSPEPTGPRQ
ncbi:MAG: hypothetical protein HC855_16730 [Rhizobiales bacterium]|nr:hypothetical protein [Hyphomicrobiales bacterium]